jgi:hypothetical protein
MGINQKLARVIVGRSVERVQQDVALLTLTFSDGSTIEVRLEAEASSVMVRDSQGTIEYAD